MKSPMRQITAIWLLLLAAATAWTVKAYEQTRPRLAVRNRMERLQQARREADAFQNKDARAAVAAVREFFLDYPDVREPRLRLKLALRMAGESEADLSASADELERAAMGVLAGLPTDRKPTRKDFENAGFEFGDGYGWGSWPEPFQVVDVDGDGRADLLMAFPNETPSDCCLFRHTEKGWIAYRFGLGIPVLGFWTFPITKGGPMAIVLAGLADSDYDPNVFFDVFVWQHERLNSVLSTIIAHGWQWDHKDLDRDGRQEIRLFGYTGPIDWNSMPPRTKRVYRWSGEAYVTQGPGGGTPTKPPAKGSSGSFAPVVSPNLPFPPSQSLREELDRLESSLFDERAYRKSLNDLQDFTERVGRSSLSDADKTDLRLEAYFHESICRRKLGETREAETLLTALWRGAPDSPWSRLAKSRLAVR